MSELDTCCTEDAAATARPLPPNEPDQYAVRFRIGTYDTFLRRMLAALPAQAVPDSSLSNPLRALRNRAADDPTVALLDAWAAVEDVLTFYQERIANEGFLRTATERRSVREMSRMAGRELSAGVAASAYLAFTVEDAPGTQGRAAIPPGTQVQSLPGPEQLAQVFETAAPLEAWLLWNELRLRPVAPQRLYLKSGAPLPFIDAALQVPSETLVFAGSALQLGGGDVLLLTQGSTRCIVDVNTVEVDAAANVTRVALTSKAVSPPEGALDTPAAHGFSTPTPTLLDAAFARSDILQNTVSEQELSSYILARGWEPARVRELVSSLRDEEGPVQVLVFRQRVGCYGHNITPSAGGGPAPPNPTKLTNEEWTKAWQALKVNDSIWQSPLGPSWPAGADLFLERSLPQVVPGSWVVLRDSDSDSGNSAAFRVKKVVEATPGNSTVVNRASGLVLVPEDLPSPRPAYGRCTTTVFAVGAPLQLAPLPMTAPVQPREPLVLDDLVLGLSVGQPLWVHGELADAPAVFTDEITTLTAVEHRAGNTVLTLSGPLAGPYRRDSLTVCANVVGATHGDSGPAEVLGSGDAAQRGQQFALKRPRITWSTAATGSGTQPAVVILVNGVPWRYVESLYSAGSQERCFTVRVDESDQATVAFGDGVHGARLPTGSDNIVAVYRTCDPAQGRVPAGSLSQLITRPLGVSAVINPLPASGNAPPESLEDGRINAPLGTLLLDRIVTLVDYERFARAFAGIAKASARLLANGTTRVVHITVAGDDGAAVPEAVQNLLAEAIYRAADPRQQVQVDSYTPRTFRIGARLVMAPGADVPAVMRAADAALRTRFGFDGKELAQSVAATEVIAALQGVPGVRAALLIDLRPTASPGPQRQSRILAQPARVESQRILPAELLLVDPSAIVLANVPS